MYARGIYKKHRTACISNASCLTIMTFVIGVILAKVDFQLFQVTDVFFSGLF